MRKLKLQVQMTIDGFIAGPNGEQDWMTFTWAEKLADFVNDLTDSSDTILLGRKMSADFLPYWTKAAADPDSPENEFAHKMVDTRKVLFSKTLKSIDYKNTTIASGDLFEEVNKLKQEEGKDIIVYGGASFDASLISAGLIDEFYLFINPVAIGDGLSIFKKGDQQKLELIDAHPFEDGIVVMHYRPKDHSHEQH